MQRREFLVAMPIVATAAAASAGSEMLSAEPKPETEKAKPETASKTSLRFHRDGSFRILSISDLHYTDTPDTYALALTEKLIQTERPDLLIVNGDGLRGGLVDSADKMHTAAAHVAEVMEKMSVPWAVTLGNHDQDGEKWNHLTREQIMQLFEAYPHNLNSGWNREINGVGNKNLLLWDADGSKPLFNLWLLDSGAELPDKSVHYDWIHTDQINWYRQTSLQLEKTYGEKISSLMFFHICIPEFREMVASSHLIGDRGEPESGSNINGGLFASVMERKDVKGIICGHDHLNNYVGKYRGVILGYDGSAGFTKSYPYFASKDPKDPAQGHVRGGRVFVLNAADPGVFDTWMRFLDGSRSWESSYPL